MTILGSATALAQEASAPTLDEKIGQLLLVGIKDTETSLNDISQYHLGGVILYDHNIGRPKELRQLTSRLHAASKKPLFIAIDEEGGLVTRLRREKGYTYKPSATTMGVLGTEKTYDFSKQTAEELAQLGINFNFAPVTDLMINSHNRVIFKAMRGFSSDPYAVTGHASRFVDGHRDHSILTTLKHFPGHGNTLQDSHRGFVDMTHSWSTDELIPYSRMIRSGHADSIMVGHLYHQNLDPTYPATLSPRLINTVLREELQFDGVVIADDMQMGAIVKHYDLETAIKLAINAGVDLLIFGQMLGHTPVPLLHQTLKDLVLSEEISEARIDESYARILKLKQKLRVNNEK